MTTIAGTPRCCLLLLLAFSAADARSIQGARCELSIDYRKGDLKEPQPLILTEAEEPTFLLPDQHRLLLIPANASILLLDLLVYTGVHGVTSLPDVEGVEQPLYLFVNATEKAFPVPRFYWKIIHDPVGNRATAFVGLNEPYASEITEDMYLCPDVSQQEGFSWIGWEPRDIEKGVSYVCSVAELRKSVPTIPALGETGLLL
ncbi:hypothetical protein TSAR_016649 [Trichomalopsis sarcophagae]|uniref:Uncharacterized protein n=1 Tax=Trichomalopsis sarcophagae TaxID=543379 RepID=A0A232F642_9HYME|nr:hypothetical protein TSAR_016649 [Trichomalopsis sarcophagae]